MSADWKTIVEFADRFADDRNTAPPSQAAIERAFEGYLAAIEFRNCVIRWSYLAALGLKAGP